MSSSPAVEDRTLLRWPRFTVKFAFARQLHGIDGSFKPDEVVLFDPRRTDGTRWISAQAGSYVSIESIR
jgi:hypothetical protein